MVYNYIIYKENEPTHLHRIRRGRPQENRERNSRTVWRSEEGDSKTNGHWEKAKKKSKDSVVTGLEPWCEFLRRGLYSL